MPACRPLRFLASRLRARRVCVGEGRKVPTDQGVNMRGVAARHSGRSARRPILVSIVVAAAVAATAPAHADPFAGRTRTATGAFDLVGSDGGNYRLSLTVQEAEPLGGDASAQLAVD